MALEFNPETHTYLLDDKRIPSVTQALTHISGYGNDIPQHVMEQARQRGTAVHRAIELWNQGDLDEFSLHEDLVGYVFAYQAFAKTTGFKPTEQELLVHSEKLRFAGTLDLLGKDFTTKFDAIVDIKTTATKMPSVGPQLAGYEIALRELRRINRGRTIKRYGLLLRKDGTFDLDEYKGNNDKIVFLACLTVTKFLENH